MAAEVFLRSVARCGFFRANCVVALALLLPWFVLGQQPPKQASGKAAIRGTVTDQTQAVVTGAKVVLSNAAGLKQESQTDDKGTYAFTALEAGTYNLSIAAPNFALKILDNITLTEG